MRNGHGILAASDEMQTIDPPPPVGHERRRVTDDDEGRDDVAVQVLEHFVGLEHQEGLHGAAPDDGHCDGEPVGQRCRAAKRVPYLRLIERVADERLDDRRLLRPRRGSRVWRRRGSISVRPMINTAAPSCASHAADAPPIPPPPPVTNAACPARGFSTTCRSLRSAPLGRQAGERQGRTPPPWLAEPERDPDRGRGPACAWS